MSKFSFAIPWLPSKKPRPDEDLVDRLNCYASALLVASCAVFVFARTYVVGEPIQCWVPKEFPDGWEQYVESYCFVESTYYVGFDQATLLPTKDTPRGPRIISYYQWVPVVLAIQAFMFLVPHYLWRVLNWQSGIHVRSIMQMASNKDVKSEDSAEMVHVITNHLIQAIQQEHRLKHIKEKGSFFTSGLGLIKGCGFYVTILYLTIKLLFIVNLILQFFIMKDFLGVEVGWGATVLADLLAGRHWNVTGNFPRVTFCDFKIRTMGNYHDRTVQCVININMFTEKIYIFIWWWCLVVSIVTSLSFLYWALVSLISSQRAAFVKSYLKINKSPEDCDAIEHNMPCFIKTLRMDGVFVLRMINHNAGDYVTQKAICGLYDHIFPKPTEQPLPLPVVSPKPSAPEPLKMYTENIYPKISEADINRRSNAPSAPKLSSDLQ